MPMPSMMQTTMTKPDIPISLPGRLIPQKPEKEVALPQDILFFNISFPREAVIFKSEAFAYFPYRRYGFRADSTRMVVAGPCPG